MTYQVDIPKRYQEVNTECLSELKGFDLIHDFLFHARYWKCTKYKFDNSEGWTDQAFRVLFLGGSLGTGKTHTLCAIAKAYSVRASCIFTTAFDMMDYILKEKDSQKYKDTSLLIIDEMGRAFESEAARNRFFDLINHRYENQKPVVFGGNITQQQLANILGKALTDRIKTDYRKVFLTGESKRG